MIDFGKGVSYEEFINTATEEELTVIEKFERQGQISEKGIEEIVCIEKEVNIVVFSMTRCQDAATTLPILMKLSDFNSLINIYFYNKEGNEDLMKELTGEVRVPTILVVDNQGKVSGKYLEFPKFINDKIEQNKDEKESIVKELRSGKYNKYIQQDLVKLLTGK